MSDEELMKEAREAFELAADAEPEKRREALDDLRLAARARSGRSRFGGSGSSKGGSC